MQPTYEQAVGEQLPTGENAERVDPVVGRTAKVKRWMVGAGVFLVVGGLVVWICTGDQPGPRETLNVAAPRPQATPTDDQARSSRMEAELDKEVGPKPEVASGTPSGVQTVNGSNPGTPPAMFLETQAPPAAVGLGANPTDGRPRGGEPPMPTPTPRFPEPPSEPPPLPTAGGGQFGPAFQANYAGDTQKLEAELKSKSVVVIGTERRGGRTIPTPAALPVGTTIRASISQRVFAVPGTTVAAVVTQAVTTPDRTVPAGALLVGQVTGEQGERIYVDFDRILLADGSTLRLRAVVRDKRDGADGLAGKRDRDWSALANGLKQTGMRMAQGAAALVPLVGPQLGGQFGGQFGGAAFDVGYGYGGFDLSVSAGRGKRKPLYAPGGEIVALVVGEKPGPTAPTRIADFNAAPGTWEFPATPIQPQYQPQPFGPYQQNQPQPLLTAQYPQYPQYPPQPQQPAPQFPLSRTR